MTLHYASGGAASAVAAAGFNLVDVQTVEELNALPEGMMGLVWLDEGSGVTASFLQKVQAFAGNPKLFGFFLVDEPDPTGQWNTLARPQDLMAESDWIHTHLPGAKTFITMMDMGTPENPNFANTYNPANTHIDYFGIDPYPIRSEAAVVDYNMIDRAVAAAIAAGIPADQLIPVFQTFGGGNWLDNNGGRYVLPTAAQMQTMLDHWANLLPNPAFDYAYSWGSQNGDTALGTSLALQQVFLAHNLATVAGGLMLNGLAGADVLTGAAGNDTINGMAGNDTLSGMAGNDTIDGGAGNDTLFGGLGSDILRGGDGVDTLWANGGSDQAWGGTGNDFIYSGATDAISALGEAGDDQIATGAGTDYIDGGAGNDIIVAGAGSDRIIGGAGNDALAGSRGNDVFTGGAGFDYFNLTQDVRAGEYDQITDWSLTDDYLYLPTAYSAVATYGNYTGGAYVLITMGASYYAVYAAGATAADLAQSTFFV